MEREIADRIPSPLLERIAGYVSTIPDPFLACERVNEMLEGSGRGKSTPTFCVDYTNRCTPLRDALSDATNVFAYRDIVCEPDNLWSPNAWMPMFHDVLSDEEKAAVFRSLEREELPVDALLTVATPAPFGKSGETVFDPDIRKAFEIPRDRLPPDLLKALEISPSSELTNAEIAMKPAGSTWRYQLYKLHMYGPGGKFEDHVDTLHAADHVATVVLALPSTHVGGLLRVRHNGEAVEFDFSKKPRLNKYRRKFLRYGVFFTDCTHSVQEVTSGWRVVIQYDVYETRASDDVDREIDGTDSEDDKLEVERVYRYFPQDESRATKPLPSRLMKNRDQSELIRAISEYMAAIPSSKGVAFFLRHRYSLPSLNLNVLKGADRVIYDALSTRPDWSLAIQGVLVYTLQRGEEEENEDGYDPRSIDVRAVSLQDFLPLPEEYVSTEDYASSVSSADSEEAKNQGEADDVHLIVDDRNGATVVREDWEQLNGNDAGDHNLTYFVACMIVRSITGQKQ